MTDESFNDGWSVQPKISVFAQLRGGTEASPVELPHDALIAGERGPTHAAAQAYFPGGVFEYTKTIHIPAQWRDRRVTLHFQGAYRDAMVFVNEGFAAQRPNGYADFYVELDPFLRYDAANTIRVETRSRDDSRWYTGAGLYRDVRLRVSEFTHIAPRGVTVTTPDVDTERAVVEVAVQVRNAGVTTETRVVDASIESPAGVATASATSPVTVRPGESATVRLRLYVDDPDVWSVDRPSLHRLSVALRAGDRVADGHHLAFGIRTLSLDPKHGLRINGEHVKLRGTCVHHDNGILGAAAYRRAEERKAELLKDAGFNAVRAAHSPFSDAFLDACDRIGLLVIDEAFDVWADSKSPLDYSLSFGEWWERDLEAMVAKDKNHPSVIMYSIGNEILEVGNPFGAASGRALAEKLRALDPTRYITNGINAMVSVMPQVITMMSNHPRAEEDAPSGEGGVNAVMAAGQGALQQVTTSSLVGESTEESFAVLDVAGWNYGDARYVMDLETFPNRIVVGTETFPSSIAANWELVSGHPAIIGDFTWTGLDYLGEVGIGRMQYIDEHYSFEAPYPWIAAWCGDLDITGHRRPASYYREIAFGLRNSPYIAVQRPQTFSRTPMQRQWSWSDAIASWTWDVPEGTPVRVEVYSDEEEVELLVNGRRIGIGRVGEEVPLTAMFETTYTAGEVTAVAYRASAAVGQTTLRSATGPTRLQLTSDRDVIRADDGDLAFIAVELRDQNGILVTSEDRAVTLEIHGAGVIKAFGSGRPETTERYDANAHTTFDGRALAVVRPTGAGTIRLTATADGMPPAAITIQVEAPDTTREGTQ